MAVASQHGSPLFCHAVGLGVAGPVTDADLDRVAAFYAGRGARYQMAAAPSATGRPGATGCWRAAIRPARPWMTFHRAGGRCRGTGDAVRSRSPGRGTLGGRVRRHRGRGVPAAARLRGLDRRARRRPGQTCLLALDGDVPVGAAVLVVAGDARGSASGATLPEHRGKGAQGALFAARSRRARAPAPATS